jgi:hypothetical protein
MLRRLATVATCPLLLVAGVAGARDLGRDARLRLCGDETCVVLTGERADASDAVTVAGHPVAVEGGRRFSVAVPLDRVRAWSAPYARTIAVTTLDRSGEATTRDVRLPIGLLGHVTELASLEVRSR